MKFPVYLSLLTEAERTLAESFRAVAEAHGDEPDVHFICLTLAGQCDEHEARLRPFLEKYGTAGGDDEPERLHAAGLEKTRSGPLGLLRDLQDLYLLASMTDITWTMIGQVASALPDSELIDAVSTCEGDTSLQLRWLQTRMSQAAPQALIAAR